MNFELSYTSKEITPWGGMVFLRQMLDKIDFKKHISNCEYLPKQNSNRGHSVQTIIESFTTSIWCGANKFLHTELTRSDIALSKIFGWDKVPGNDAYKRYFNKFNQVTNQETAKHFFSYFFKNINIDYFTLDIDSTIFTRYGEQEGSKKGYNSSKRGRKSHHPIIAFVNEIRMVANFWLRSGDTSSATNFIPFLENTLANFGNKKVGLVRLDSGFCQKSVMDYLEEKQLQYIVAAKFTKPIQHLIDGTQVWIKVDDDIEICNQAYRAGSWENPRRLVIVRRKITNKDKTIGKTLSLFPEDEIHKNYKYSAYFTNQITGAVDVWRCYRARGDAENRIKELKQDFGMDSFVLKDFFASEAALLFVMFAYNLMSTFRIFVLQEKTQKTLSTLRHRVFAIGAYFEKSNNTLKLKISLRKKRRKWFESLWDYPINLSMKISNA